MTMKDRFNNMVDKSESAFGKRKEGSIPHGDTRRWSRTTCPKECHPKNVLGRKRV
jgi:hypothetical protein